jgi:hypothetical protein
LVGKPNTPSDPGRLAERHDLGTGVVPIAADGDVGIGPVLADMTHQAPDVAGTFGTRRRLASAQQHRHRPPLAVSYTWIGRKQRSQ